MTPDAGPMIGRDEGRPVDALGRPDVSGASGGPLDPKGVGGCPDLARHLRAAKRARASRSELGELRRQMSRHNESLANRFESVLRLLEAWGHLDGWSLTDRGQILARVFHESDLLVAEAVAEGVFDGLSAPELAGVASALTYEHRSPLPPAPPWFPSTVSRQRVDALERIARDLNADEDQLGLALTRLPDPTFFPMAYSWANGTPLDVVLEDEGISPGDFVRNIKQLVDLIRQIATTTKEPTTRTAARAAGEALFRGVVALSAEMPGGVNRIASP